jgi:hypothetical protein
VPHRQETFKLSSDPLFIDKVRDIDAERPSSGQLRRLDKRASRTRIFLLDTQCFRFADLQAALKASSSSP